jgi:tRNA-modifying protein YgfZ
MIDFDSKASPLLEYFESLGFKSDGNNGSSVFTKYSSVDEELNSLYNGVGVRDISNCGILELRGNDVRDFLHRITTNSIKELPKERAVRTILTTEKGRIIDVITLLNFGEYKFVITNPANKLKVKSWIEKYVIMDDVKVSDINKKYVLLEILGPQAVSFATLFVGNIQNEIGFNQFKVIHSDGILFFILKLEDDKGNPKFWILAETQNGMKLVKSMKEYTGPFGFNFIGNEAYEIYRIEHGIPSAPNELNGSFNPYEVDLIKLVDFNKGCYIGQEVIARLDTYDKVQKNIKGIKFLSEPNGNENLLLYDNENKEAGQVTSFIFSKELNNWIGLGLVRKAYLAEGTILSAKSENGKAVQIQVENLPFKK